MLSLFAPGLGHLFLGELRRAVVFYAVFLVGLAVGLVSFLMVPAAPMNVVFAVAIWLPCYLGPALHASRTAQVGELMHLSEAPWRLVVVALIAATLVGNGYNFAIRMVVAEAVKADSRSMEPAILVGDRVMVNKLSYVFGKIEKGDVVAVSVPEAPQPEIVFKRVVGLPGETVEVGDEAVTVPDGRYYVLGDRRERSQDSRDWGAISKDEIVGRASRVSVSLDPEARSIRWSRTGSIVR